MDVVPAVVWGLRVPFLVLAVAELALAVVLGPEVVLAAAQAAEQRQKERSVPPGAAWARESDSFAAQAAVGQSEGWAEESGPLLCRG